MKTNTYIVILAVAVIMASCTAQSRLSSRLSGEWAIEKYESRTADGSTSSIENAGSITINSNGRGTQSFTTAIAHGGVSSSDEFRWENTAHTISIKGEDAEYPKVWIIVDSGRNSQQWFSTNDEGNVQMMQLKKK